MNKRICWLDIVLDLRALAPSCLGIVTLAGTLLLSTKAVAAASASSSELPIGRFVLFALLTGAVYLALRVGLDGVRKKRGLIIPGVEHILFGLLLGPLVFGLGVFGEVSPLVPFATTVAGWVAMSCGTDFNLHTLSDPPRGGPRLGAFAAAISGTTVAVAAWAVFTSGWFGRVAEDDAWFTAGWMGCAAAATSNAPLDFIRSRYNTGEKTCLLLRRGVRFANLIAIVAFGVLACAYRPGYSLGDRPLSPVELSVIAIGLGAVLGMVLSPYIGRFDSLAGRVLVLAAMVAFGSGAATWFGLSPLWVNLTLGIVLVNASLANDRLVQAVRLANPGAVMVLLVLCGALWSPPPLLPALTITAIFIALRLFARLLASWIVARWLAPMRADTGRGLLGQGEVAIAVAVAFRVSSEGPMVDVGFSAIIVSVLFFDVVAPRALRGLLLDAGELHRAAGAKG